MNTRISAVVVAVLATFAAAACDDSSSNTLGNGTGTGDRLPQRTANGDPTPGQDPDSTGANGTPAAGTPAAPGAAAPGAAAPGAPGAAGIATPTTSTNVAVLNTFSKIWVSGDDKGPAKLGKLTGAGTMDANFAFDDTDKANVQLLAEYTRSDAKANNNNSYLQGGVSFATLTAKGVVQGAEVALPNLDGDRTWMRPNGMFVSNGRALLIAASEDNGVNNNPQPVAFLVDVKSGKVLPQPNNTRGATNVLKPTNLIQVALADKINVDNPNNQRGPHSCVADETKPDTFICGMQYNNQAQEALSVSVAADNSMKVNWLVRYSNTAQHCRPQVVSIPGTANFAIAAVEANNQPAEIGYRVSIADKATGKPSLSKIVVRSDPKNNKYVSEPVIGLINNSKLAVTYGLSSSVRQNNNGNGHAGGKMVGAAVLINATDLSVAGDPALAVGQYGRHGSSFITGYGPNSEAALAVISGSSTGTGGGFIQMYPLGADGMLGVKDPNKVYQVSAFSDVANVQARGKRNPNNQARGFISGKGNVPNPGYTTDPTAATANFMPEVKAFSFSTVTGYSSAAAMTTGLKNSIWLSLVPAAWQDGIQTVPGTPTDKPGTNPDGTGPAPRTTAQATNPSGDSTGNGSVLGTDATHPGGAATTGSADGGGCAMAPTSTQNSGSNAGLFGLAVAAALVIARRKREEV